MKIETLDLHFQDVPQIIASYLVEGPGGLVLIETGPISTLPTLLEQLAGRGLSPADIRHVLVTHIHLDHAGAAGWWAQQGAQIYVHPIGAPHLVDPSRLLASAHRIYGDKLEAIWGQVLPAPAGRVTAVPDGQQINVAGLTFTALDTPGHAWHHHAYRLEDIAFCGDAAGVRLSGHPWISFPAPPPEFNLEAWLKTIERLRGEQLNALYLTHFDRAADVDNHLERLRTLMTQAAEFVHVRLQEGMGRNRLVREYVVWIWEQAMATGLAESDLRQYESVIPTSMSVDGMMRYWHLRQQLSIG